VSKQSLNEFFLIEQLREGDCSLFIQSIQTKQPKQIQISINCLFRLLQIKAVNDQEIQKIIRVMADIQGNELKILQIILLIYQQYKITRVELYDSLGLANKLQMTGGVVGNTAEATFRQLILQPFENLLETNQDLSQQTTLVDALLIFKVLNSN
jgi:hypothetical protein